MLLAPTGHAGRKARRERLRPAFGNPTVLLAQITDLHVVEDGALAMGAMDTNAALARCVDRINRFLPSVDLVIATGDLTHDGRPEQYAMLRRLLAPLAARLLLLPGNHDDREALRAAFANDPRLPAAEPVFLHYVAAVGPLRLIALDTVVAGAGGGRLCPVRLGWLAARLAEAPEAPTVIAMHHPPFVTGIGFMDRLGLEGRDDLAGVLARYRNIERILCGHVHIPIVSRFAGTVASIGPGTAHQGYLALDQQQSDAWTREPPAFQLHSWQPPGGLVSYTAYIEHESPPILY